MVQDRRIQLHEQMDYLDNRFDKFLLELFQMMGLEKVNNFGKSDFHFLYHI